MAVTKTVNYDVLEKLPDGNFKKKNPSTTKSQAGLGNVDNVKQASKAEFDSHVGSKSVHGLKDSAIAIGAHSSVEDTNGIAIGNWVKVIGTSAGVVLGNYSSVSGYDAIAIGSDVSAANGYEGVLGGAEALQSPHKWLIPGELNVSGTKNFEIPHPKPEKKATHRIRHGAVESPSAGDTLYRYKVQSVKDDDIQYIDLPDYFVWLNKNVQVFVTPQGHFGNGYGVLNRETEQLEIHCQYAGEYNVLAIGTRNDGHQSVQDWDIKGVEREVGESWTGETYVFEVNEIMEVEEIKEVA